MSVRQGFAGGDSAKMPSTTIVATNYLPVGI